MHKEKETAALKGVVLANTAVKLTSRSTEVAK